MDDVHQTAVVVVEEKETLQEDLLDQIVGEGGVDTLVPVPVTPIPTVPGVFCPSPVSLRRSPVLSGTGSLPNG